MTSHNLSPGRLEVLTGPGAQPELPIRAAPDFRSGPPDQGIDWARAVTALRRARWVVALATMLGTVGGIAATRFIKPVYVAQATIWVEQPNRQTTGRDRGPLRTEQLLQAVAWVDLLKSYQVLDGVVRELHLFVVPGSPEDSAALSGLRVTDQFRPGDYRVTVDTSEHTVRLETAGGVELDRQPMGDSLGTKLGFLWKPTPASLVSVRQFDFTVVPPRDAAFRLADELQIHTDPEGNFIRMELQGGDPRSVTAMVNAVAAHTGSTDEFGQAVSA